MKRLLKWAGLGVGAIAGLLLLAASALYGVSQYRFQRSYEVNPPAIAATLLTGPSAIERGRHVATVRGCVDCHGDGFSGKVFIDEPMVGRLYSPNLTRGEGGVGAQYGSADWVRAIRHGIGPDGKPLLFMPAQEFNVLSDEDMGALIAYLESLPEVDRVASFENRVGPVGRALFLTGRLPLVPAELIDHQAERGEPPVPGPTAEYGAYLATSCAGCHGENFSGGPIPGAPPGFPEATNLTPDPATGLGTWTEHDFMTALRTGKRPDGTELAPEMPWRLAAQMTDDEIRALWRYLQTLAPLSEGNR